MSKNPVASARALETSPWGQQSEQLDGRGGFPGSSPWASPAIQVPRPDMCSPLSFNEAKSGLTRRGLVYDYIRAHPGAHVRGIAKHLRLANGDLQYHLFWLERNGFIKTKRNGFYRFVYPTMVFQERQEVLLSVLYQETPRDILLCLLHDPTITQGELARSLAHSQPTISWHLERLVRNGLVAKEKTRKGTAYKLSADRDEVMSFVKAYHPDVWRRWSGRLAHVILVVGATRVGKGGAAQRARQMPPSVVETIGS
jgi:DNA-binding MarR family transcriptional regulator